MTNFADLDAIARGLAEIALAAGPAVMEEYARAGSGREKADGSPVTAADERAEAIILERLSAFAPDVAVVAEEACAAVRSCMASPSPSPIGATRPAWRNARRFMKFGPKSLSDSEHLHVYEFTGSSDRIQH